MLQKKFRKVFKANCNDKFFQKFEPDWNEYIDLDECTELANKDKLKAILVVVNEVSGSQISSVGSEAGLNFPVGESSQLFTEQQQSNSAVELFSTINKVSHG